jgi:hypothetical protein
VQPATRRKILLRLLLAAFGLLLPLLLGEIILRFLPVYSGMRLAPINADNPVPHFTPNQDVVWSLGWDFKLVNRLRINNDGFVNDQDYDSQAASPLLAIVGDSYIEAAMVPYAETVQGRLQKELGRPGRVYSFGKSGAPLSTYLIWAEHACKTYRPAGLMISVVGNDFDESLSQYKSMQNGYYYVEGSNQELELKRFDYAPSLLRVVARQSALFRYLSWNVHIEGVWYNLWHRHEEFVGNKQARVGGQVVADSQRAVDAFFRDLPKLTGLPPESILFTLDALRPEIYSAGDLVRAEESFVAQMRRFFLQAARSRGYEVIDLQPAFIADFQKRSRRFEYPEDNHWNSTGHEVVAQQVRRSQVYQRVFVSPAVSHK